MSSSEKGSGANRDESTNPNALHDFHFMNHGVKGVPDVIAVQQQQQQQQQPSTPKSPAHSWADTHHISFQFYDQRTSNAPFGYEHFVSLPPAYDKEPERLWPLILFLHGSGESQRSEHQSFLSIRHGIPKLILCYDKLKAEPGDKTPFIFVPRTKKVDKNKQAKSTDRSEEPVSAETCTLLAENFITVTPSLVMTYGYGWNAPILSALLDEIVQRYRVDKDRIHVTGFSMGGYGTWALGMRTPSRFATLMPICGGGDPSRVNHIKHIPQWVHHGDLDDVVPVAASTQMVAALKNSGALSVEYTIYPETKHDSWTDAYSKPEVYKWMLSIRRSVQGDEEGVPEANKVIVV